MEAAMAMKEDNPFWIKQTQSVIRSQGPGYLAGYDFSLPELCDSATNFNEIFYLYF